MTNQFGFDPRVWEEAKDEAKTILAGYARRRQMVSYSDLFRLIHTISLDPHDLRVGPFLGEISTEESTAGRGMLSALVVHKQGDFQPGPGFFECAEALGHEVADRETFWVQELKRVFAAWAE